MCQINDIHLQMYLTNRSSIYEISVGIYCDAPIEENIFIDYNNVGGIFSGGS